MIIWSYLISAVSMMSRMVMTSKMISKTATNFGTAKILESRQPCKVSPCLHLFLCYCILRQAHEQRLSIKLLKFKSEFPLTPCGKHQEELPPAELLPDEPLPQPTPARFFLQSKDFRTCKDFWNCKDSLHSHPFLCICYSSQNKALFPTQASKVGG